MSTLVLTCIDIFWSKMEKEKNCKIQPGQRRAWFKCVKTVLKLFIKKPRFVFLGEEFQDRALILSNHVGATGPLTLEMYFPKPFRFWGTYEMNSSVKEVYKYLSEIYFYQKKHWNKVLAKLFSLIAAPIAWLFYRGLTLISTYRDHRFKNTLKESVRTLEHNASLIIFPEDSSNGYFNTITGFFSGFVTLAKYCHKKGFDLPIYLTYLRKKERIYVIDKPIYYTELIATGLDKYQIAEYLRVRCNELGTMPLPPQ